MEDISRYILEAGGSDSLKNYVAGLLLEICRIDTTPYPDVNKMRDAESRVFDILERELDTLGFKDARRERKAVDPAIAEHPAFSLLHFTKTDEKPEGLPPETVYAERGNLLYLVPGKDGYAGPDGIAVNAHIDVVKPYIPPRLEKNILYGRGSCDDKGAIVSMISALKVLDDALRNSGKTLAKNLVNMFVIEEETGGNGSLSLALDRDLKKLYNSMLVLECAGNNIHPANRGAVWYKADLSCPGANLFEMSAFVIEQLEQEGRAIRSESRHSLFPQRPVQTCHGIIGPYGEHPSRICGEVSFLIEFGKQPVEAVETLVRDVIEFALAEYIDVYGDKTTDNDPTTGKPKVDHHYDLVATTAGFRCDVHGSTGHMGSILENDGAITKMAAFVRGLCRSKAKIAAAANANVQLSLANSPNGTALTLEGGQGFVPTHDITEIMERVRKAAREGAAHYLRMARIDPHEANVATVTYDKLHNAAFDGNPDSKAMKHAILAAKEAGIWQDQEITGWTVSCDSRLFACEYPDMPVITSGAGHLLYAHGDEEQIDLDELLRSIAFIALYLAKTAGLTDA